MVYRCPVCGGNGIVPGGFYLQTTGTWMATDTGGEECRSCKGKGFVAVETPGEADAR